MPSKEFSTQSTLVYFALFFTSALFFLLSFLKFEPQSYSQYLDFIYYHWQGIEKFAHEDFWESVKNYPSASFPTFHILLAGVYLLFDGSVLSVLLATLLISLLAVWLLMKSARYQHSELPWWPYAVALTFLLSLYFRNTATQGNTDTLPLVFIGLALIIYNSKKDALQHLPSVLLIVVCTCMAYYVRQIYIFLPAYFALLIFWENGFKFNRVVVSSALTFGVFALPTLYLFYHWGGPTPPGFSNAMFLENNAVVTLPLVALNTLTYLLPLILITAIYFRKDFLSFSRSPINLGLTSFIFSLGLIVYWMFGGNYILPSMGGGMILKAIQFFLPQFLWPVAIGFLVFLSLLYLIYIYRQNAKMNLALILAIIQFIPVTFITQKYFDPLLLVVILFLTSAQEIRFMKSRSSWALSYPLYNVMITIIAFVFYGFFDSRLASYMPWNN